MTDEKKECKRIGTIEVGVWQVENLADVPSSVDMETGNPDTMGYYFVKGNASGTKLWDGSYKWSLAPEVNPQIHIKLAQSETPKPLEDMIGKTVKGKLKPAINAGESLDPEDMLSADEMEAIRDNDISWRSHTTAMADKKFCFDFGQLMALLNIERDNVKQVDFSHLFEQKGE